MLQRWPIHLACQRSSTLAYGVVQCLLQTNKTCRLAVDKNKNMPIHLAIQAENTLVIQLLLQREAHKQIRSTDELGNTPMHLASKRRKNFLNFKKEFFLRI